NRTDPRRLSRPSVFTAVRPTYRQLLPRNTTSRSRPDWGPSPLIFSGSDIWAIKQRQNGSSERRTHRPKSSERIVHIAVPVFDFFERSECANGLHPILRADTGARLLLFLFRRFTRIRGKRRERRIEVRTVGSPSFGVGTVVGPVGIHI